MRGYAEESAEVKALRALKRAAERFAGHALLQGYVTSVEDEDLTKAAVAYAATQPRPRKPRKGKL